MPFAGLDETRPPSASPKKKAPSDRPPQRREGHLLRRADDAQHPRHHARPGPRHDVGRRHADPAVLQRRDSGRGGGRLHRARARPRFWPAGCCRTAPSKFPPILLGGQAGFILAGALIGWGGRTLALRAAARRRRPICSPSSPAPRLCWSGPASWRPSSRNTTSRCCPTRSKIAFGVCELAGADRFPGLGGPRMSSRARNPAAPSRLPKAWSSPIDWPRRSSRALAWAVDAAAIGAACYVVGQAAGGLERAQPAMWPPRSASCSTSSISIGYGIVLEWRWRGQTLGKRAARACAWWMRKACACSSRRSSLRNLLRAVDMLPLLLPGRRHRRAVSRKASAWAIWRPTPSWRASASLARARPGTDRPRQIQFPAGLPAPGRAPAQPRRAPKPSAIAVSAAHPARRLRPRRARRALRRTGRLLPLAGRIPRAGARRPHRRAIRPQRPARDLRRGSACCKIASDMFGYSAQPPLLSTQPQPPFFSHMRFFPYLLILTCSGAWAQKKTVFLITDAEGVGGVCRQDQTDPKDQEMRQLLTGEINAAVEAFWPAAPTRSSSGMATTAARRSPRSRFIPKPSC